MIKKDQLESALRRLPRPPLPGDLRGRVLAAAHAVAGRGAGNRVRPYWSWRFAAIASVLAVFVAAVIWSVGRMPPARRANPPRAQQTQFTRPPGDEVVVFWLDDDTPVLVDLAEMR